MRLAPGFTKHKLRALAHRFHQWLGLTLGLLFAMLGLTGSLLVFYPELDSLLNSQRAASSPNGIISFNPVVDALRQSEPSRRDGWRIEPAHRSNAPISARYYKPEETRHRSFAPLIVTLDTSTFQITNRRFWGDDLFTWIYDLHYTLLLGDSGKAILGIGAILTLLLLLSGLFLWWPSGGNWKGAFTIKSGAAWKRRGYDLHAKPGALSVPLLAALTATGLLLAAPHWFTPSLHRLSPLTPYYQANAEPQPRAQASQARQISADEAIHIARQQFPSAEVRWIHTPSAQQAVWRIQMRQAGEPNRRFPRTNVWIDANTGDILAIRDPRNNSAGDALMDWLHPLHNGEAFGLAGRIIAFACGLLPLLALVTGFIRWRHKREAAQRKQARLP